MQKYFLVFVVFAMNSLLVSCSDTLDVKPIDSVSSQYYFNNQNDFEQAIVGLYASIRSTNTNENNGSYGGNLYWNVVSDEMFFQFSWHTPWFTISSGTVNQNSSDIASLWSTGYKSIYWANVIIAKLEEKKDLLTPEFYKAALGDAHFIRGIVYLRLTSLYGAVPMIDKVMSTPNEAKLARTPVSEVTARLIVPDLTKAAANLGTTPFEGKYGRATKQAALGMKVRALMYVNDYTGVVTAARELMTLASTSSAAVMFLDKYADIFANNNENNPEILFSIKYAATGARQGATNNTPFGSSLPGVTGTNGGWGASAITPEFADSYPMTDGKPAAQSAVYKASDKWANRGARFDYTFYIAGKSVVNGQVFSTDNLTSVGGDTYKKNYPLNLNKGYMNEGSKIDWTNEDESDFIVLRYTDVLLMYAEAKTELNQIDESVYSILNMVRKRAGIAEVPAGLSQAAMRQTIRDERKFEFAFEGIRYFDIRRWGIAKSVIDAITSDDVYNFGSKKQFSDKMNLWPVPQAAIDVNPALLPNNTGY